MRIFIIARHCLKLRVILFLCLALLNAELKSAQMGSAALGLVNALLTLIELVRLLDHVADFDGSNLANIGDHLASTTLGIKRLLNGVLSVISR
jgi:hypothetical protein